MLVVLSMVTALFAQEELERHVELMTGRPLDPGAFVVTAGDSQGDGFTIRSRGGVVTVAGESPRGALYGVYELLERFGGCGWYTPWRTVVPRRDRLIVPEGTEITERPAFVVRQPSWYGVRTNELFAARCRLNGESPDGAVPRPDPKFGGCPLRFVRPLYSSHTLLELVPPSVYFKEHPEYFSEIGGRRISVNTQLCMTHPRVVELAADRILELSAASPGSSVAGVSLMDWGNVCECATCRDVRTEEGGASGLVMRFVNAVAERVERSRPDLLVETLVYGPTRPFPRTVRPRKNVMLCICTSSDYAEPLPAAVRPRNVAFKENYEKWTSCARHLWQWDYTPNFKWFFLPHPNFAVYGPNLRYYRDHGVKYVYMDGLPLPGADFADLRSWMVAKLMWNPDVPTDDLVNRFCAGAYGAGARYARAAYDLECDRLRRNPRMTLSYWDDDRAAFFPDDYFREAIDLWQRAQEAASADPEAVFAASVAKYPNLVSLIMRLASRVPAYSVSRRSDRPVRPDGLDRLLAEESRIRSEMIRRGAAPAYSLRRGLDSWVARRIRRLREKKTPAASSSAIVSVDGFAVHDGEHTGGKWNERRGSRARILFDETAASGRVIELYPSSGEAVTFAIDDLAYDPDVPLRVAARIRTVGPVDPTGAALSFCVMDGKKVLFRRILPSADVSPRWSTVVLGEFIPRPGMVLHVSGATPETSGAAAVRLEWLRLGAVPAGVSGACRTSIHADSSAGARP